MDDNENILPDPASTDTRQRIADRVATLAALLAATRALDTAEIDTHVCTLRTVAAANDLGAETPADFVDDAIAALHTAAGVARTAELPPDSELGRLLDAVEGRRTLERGRKVTLRQVAALAQQTVEIVSGPLGGITDDDGLRASLARRYLGSLGVTIAGRSR